MEVKQFYYEGFQLAVLEQAFIYTPYDPKADHQIPLFVFVTGVLNPGQYDSTPRFVMALYRWDGTNNQITGRALQTKTAESYRDIGGSLWDTHDSLHLIVETAYRAGEQKATNEIGVVVSNLTKNR